MDDLDPYAVLKLENGEAATDAEIRKAYRKRALDCHPDKQPDPKLKKVAELEFDRVKRAYELLSDAAARKALDELARVQRARQAKDATQDAKRRKMREELERREKQAARGESELQTARNALNAELERLRKANAAKHDAARASGAPSVAPATSAAEEDPQLQRTLRVSWATACGTYSAEQLRTAFAEFGAVDDVLIREGKKKKGVALVVMADPAIAEIAAAMPVGDFSNPLEVKRMSTTSAAPPEDPLSAAGAGPAAGARAASCDGATPSAPGGGAATATAGKEGAAVVAAGAAPLMGSAHRDYENVTLMRMRQAAERARLIKQMEAKEKQADQAAD